MSRVPTLLLQDGDVWVFDKPSGYSVHSAGEKGVPDVLSWARETLGASRELAAVHRLDRATSGVLLCSPNVSVRRMLSGWFSQGEIRKEYRTLVYGCTNDRFQVERSLHNRRRQKKLPAATRCRRLRAYRLLTYLTVSPETGRRHQIRRHLRGIGHPIVGDRRYGPSRPPAVPGFPGRLWLHALRLETPDGRSFEAPLPPELQSHLALLDQIDGVAGDEPE